MMDSYKAPSTKQMSKNDSDPCLHTVFILRIKLSKGLLPNFKTALYQLRNYVLVLYMRTFEKKQLMNISTKIL